MKLNVVLYQPEIPQNTGNIMRTCVGFGAKLHLIRPLGFHLDAPHLQRSAVDYFSSLTYEVYDDWDDFLSKNNGTYFYLTRYGKNVYSNFDYKSVEGDIYLVFGKESTGIPYDILASDLPHTFRIPTSDKIRALNVSNCVAIAISEVARQLDFDGLYTSEPESLKGPDFLDQFVK